MNELGLGVARKPQVIYFGRVIEHYKIGVYETVAQSRELGYTFCYGLKKGWRSLKVASDEPPYPFLMFGHGALRGLKWRLRNSITQADLDVFRAENGLKGKQVLVFAGREDPKRLYQVAGFVAVTHAWTGSSDLEAKNWGLLRSLAGRMVKFIAHATHVLSGSRYVTPFVGRLTLGRKPVHRSEMSAILR